MVVKVREEEKEEEEEEEEDADIDTCLFRSDVEHPLSIAVF
jgi:hypothetical protein